MAVGNVQRAAAMNGELRIYKEPEFKRLRRIIGVSTGNFCYNLACSELNSIISSARWTGLPTTGSAFDDGQVKIAFYTGTNCTGKTALVSTNVGGVDNFAIFGMDNATTSFAILETWNAVQNGATNVCDW